MSNSKWMFCLKDKWCEDSVDPYEANMYASYNDAAEEIAEYLDNLQAHYPDERVFWLLNVNDTFPQKMNVTAENVRHYSSSMINTERGE